MLKLIFFLKFLNFLAKIPILKEFEGFEWFEWFGPLADRTFQLWRRRWRPPRSRRGARRRSMRRPAPRCRAAGRAQLRGPLGAPPVLFFPAAAQIVQFFQLVAQI